MNFVFDTSALVIHALDLEHSESVQSVMEDEKAGLFASALSLFELAGVLKRTGLQKKVSSYWKIYRAGLKIIPVDAEIAQAAWSLREKIGKRLPISDAIIAATAQKLTAKLVHGDKHLSQIPEKVIAQVKLLK